MSRIDIPKHKGIEVTAVLIKSKNSGLDDRPFIVFAIYSSPRSKLKNELLDFLTLQMSILSTTYPKASFFIGGDRNSISLDSLSNLYPGVHQIVTCPTRKDKILDFLCTDLF